MTKLVIFDWNGTLFSDTRACFDADNHILEVFGGKKVSLKEYRDTIIIPGNDFYVKHGVNRDRLVRESKKIGEIFHGFYEPRAAKCRLRAGAKKLLEGLQKQQIQSIILSNLTIVGIDKHLDRLKI